MKKNIIHRPIAVTLAILTLAGILGFTRAQQETVGDTARNLKAFISGQALLTGSEGAPIKVVGFIDYQCPACRKNFSKVESRLASNPNVALYVAQFPMSMQHQLATPAATLALKAEEKGIFAAVHRELLKGPQLTQSQLDHVAKEYAIEPQPTAQTRSEINTEQKAALQMKVASVPSFVVSDANSTKILTWKEVLIRFP